MEFRGDVEAALEALKSVAVNALASNRPGRLVELYRICQTAQQLIRASSVRVEDFEKDPSKSRYSYKESQNVLEAGVPSDLSEVAQKALDQIVQVVLVTLSSTKQDRFAEASRLAQVAQQFVQALVTPKPKKPSKNPLDDLEIRPTDPDGGGDPYFGLGGEEEVIFENAYAQMAPDTQELQQNYVRTKGAVTQAVREESSASLARMEAEELKTLLDIQKSCDDPVLAEAARLRIEHLKQRLALRAQGQIDGMVHPNVLRRYQPNQGRSEEDLAQGNQLNGHGTGSFGSPSGTGPQAECTVPAMGHAGSLSTLELPKLHAGEWWCFGGAPNKLG